jgi:hypothetical protein
MFFVCLCLRDAYLEWLLGAHGAALGRPVALGNQRGKAVRVRALELDLGPELLRVATLQFSRQRVRQRLRERTGRCNKERE